LLKTNINLQGVGGAKSIENPFVLVASTLHMVG
jgi:hypothetical protein